MDKKEIDIRSDAVQDILGHVPNWMVRWGTVLIFVLVASVFFLSWFIKYPDIIEGSVLVTSETPPVRVVSRFGGTISKIFIKEGSQVKAGQEIAEIEGVLSRENISLLQDLVNKARQYLTDPQEFEIDLSLLILGPIQSQYNQLISSIETYKVLTYNTFYKLEIKNIEERILGYEKLAGSLKKQIWLGKKELTNSHIGFQTNKLLFDSQAISKMEFLKEETKYIQHQQAVESLKKSRYQNEIMISTLASEYQSKKFEYGEKVRLAKEQILSSIRNIENSVAQWRQSNTLRSPINGQLVYLQHVSIGKYLNQNQPVFAIISPKENYKGYINIPAKGFGKIRKFQSVRIKLDDYPYEEFGYLLGTVEKISSVPYEGMYMVEIKLSNNQKTNFNKTLNFKPEMQGVAEIVTEEKRLIERLVFQFRRISSGG